MLMGDFCFCLEIHILRSMMLLYFSNATAIYWEVFSSSSVLICRSGEDTEVNKEKGCSSLAKHSRNKIVMSNTRAGAKVEYFREKLLLHYSILT